MTRKSQREVIVRINATKQGPMIAPVDEAAGDLEAETDKDSEAVVENEEEETKEDPRW